MTTTTKSLLILLLLSFLSVSFLIFSPHVRDIGNAYLRKKATRAYNFIPSLGNKPDDASAEHSIETLTNNKRAQRTRLAVVCYVPPGQSQVFYFLSMLFGSWKFITDREEELLFDFQNKKNILAVDLLAFAHPSVFKDIKTVCVDYKQRRKSELNAHRCWAVQQLREINIGYGPINSFVMFTRPDIYKIMKPYKYILRTDFDVFLTPTVLIWRPTKKLIAGQGGYCDTFNRKRLKYIAGKLGLVHRGMHCVGSSWYGETDLFITASKKTIELTKHLFLNEFTPNASGLETVDFVTNREGEWPKWWRPVSSMYGAEIALNHLIEDFSNEYIGKLDTPSCSTLTVWETPHIHCWHSDCEFQKFKFMTQLNQIIQQSDVDSLPVKIVHRILENVYERDVRNMTISQYSTYVAWYSVSKHLRKWFL